MVLYCPAIFLSDEDPYRLLLARNLLPLVVFIVVVVRKDSVGNPPKKQL